jgi:hypothetical protein
MIRLFFIAVALLFANQVSAQTMQALRLTPGQAYKLPVPHPGPATGYELEVKIDNPDVVSATEGKVSKARNRQVLNSPAHQTFILKGLGEGNAKIIFSQWKPGDTTTVSTVVKIVSVKVM